MNTLTRFWQRRPAAALCGAAAVALALSACSGPSPDAISRSAQPAASSPGSAAQASASAPDADTQVSTWTWADGSPVLATKATEPRLDRKVSTAVGLPSPQKVHENWLAVLPDGTPLGLAGGSTVKPATPYLGLIALKDGKTVNALDAAKDPFAKSKESIDPESELVSAAGGPFPTRVAVAGDGFVFASIENFEGFGGDIPSTTLYRVDAIGGAPTQLARIEHPKVDGFRNEVKDLVVGPDETGAQRVYWTEATSVQEGVLRSMPLAGGAIRTEGKGLEHPMPSAAGLFAIKVEYVDTIAKATAVGSVKDGAFTPLLKGSINTPQLDRFASVSPDGHSLAVSLDPEGAPADAALGGLLIDPTSRAATAVPTAFSGADDLGWTTTQGRWVGTIGDQLTFLSQGGSRATTVKGQRDTSDLSLFPGSQPGSWTLLNFHLPLVEAPTSWLAPLGEL